MIQMFLTIITLLAAQASELSCSAIKELYTATGAFDGGQTCCGNEAGTIDTSNLPCSGSMMRRPVMNKAVTTDLHGGRTYAGAVHGSIIYYAMGLRGNLGDVSSKTAIIAFDTTTDSILWSATYGEIYADSIAASVNVQVRNTPFLDTAHNLLWNSDARDSHIVFALSMDTGAVVHRFTPTPPNPINTGAMIRTGVVVEYENDVPVIYLGWAQLFAGGYVYPNYAGIFGKSTTAVPGTFYGHSGYMAKYDLSGAILWTVPTMPEIIQPEGTIPEECFRPGEDEVKVLVQFTDGFAFEDTTTYRTSGTRKLWDKDAKVERTFEFPAGTTFDVSAQYTSTSGDVVNGSSLVFYDDSISNPWGSSVSASYIGKELKRGFDLTDATWEAYHLNYFGASVWAQGIYVDGDNVVFGTGNPSHVAYDEAMMFTTSNMIYDTQEYATGAEPIENIKAKYLARDAYPKSPRGRRAWFNSVVALNKESGAPVGVIQTTPYDTAHNGFWGGFTNPYNAEWVGQPDGRPYATPESSDMDIGVGTVKLSGKTLGICNKASYCYVFATDAGHMEPAVDGDVSMMKGVKTTGFKYMNVTEPTHAGLWSWVGGINYAMSSNGNDMMFGVVRNAGGAGEHLTQPDLVTPSYGLFNVPYGTPYVVAVKSDGTVAWVTPLYDATGLSGTAYKDGKVYTTLFQDNDDNFVQEITTDDRGIKTRRGLVYELDAATGKILHIGKSVAGALWPPSVVAPDKIYALNGCQRSYTAAEGLTNFIEKYDFS